MTGLPVYSDQEVETQSNINWFRSMFYRLSPYFVCAKPVSICIALVLIALELTYDPDEEMTKTFATFIRDDIQIIDIVLFCVAAFIILACAGLILYGILNFIKNNTVCSLIMTVQTMYMFTVGSAVFFIKLFAKLNIDWSNLFLGFLVFIFFCFAILSVQKNIPVAIFKTYLILSCAFTSTACINYAPITLIWVVIIIMAFYDGFATLHRFGPFNLIIKLAKKRDVDIIKNAIYPLGDGEVMNSDDEIHADQEELGSNGGEHTISTDIVYTESGGLGLGDFFHFSLFIGIVSLEKNWYLTFICYFALIIGTAMTGFIQKVANLEIFPAIPCPIFFGMVTYYFTKLLLPILSIF